MTDTTTEQPSETTSAPADPMESVYTKFNIEDTANSFSANPPQQQQPQQQTQQAQPAQDQNIPIPDPTLDPNGYKMWETQRYRDQMALRQALSHVAGRLQNYEQQAAQKAEEADIKRAVDLVNEQLGDSKLDPDVIEISLGAEARRDKRFMALWNNRTQNPKAFNEGIKAFSQKLGKKFSMRADPQIAENQRALKEATSTKATGTAEESLTDRLGKLQGADFERAMAGIRGNYY